MNLLEIFGNMGTAGWSVISLLFLLSLYSTTITFNKLRHFRTARNQSLQFLPSLTECLKSSNLDKAVAEGKRHKRSHLARIVTAGVAEYVNPELSTLGSRERVDAVSRALERTTVLTSADFKQGLGALATIGSTAPFIGLAGTVMGIITAFQGIAATGDGGIAAVSSGIAEALITTAFGLIVAIPAVMAFNYFTGALDRIHVEMDNSSAELMDYFLKMTGKAHAQG
jgi:biopolymer transport protein ExbB/TolQ